MSRYIFDIETNGLLDTVSTVWMLVIHNLDTKENYVYSDYGDNSKGSVQDGLDLLNSGETTIIAGHNIIGYDLVVLKRLYNWVPAPHLRILDTWIWSQLNRYKRNHRHGLEGWGGKLGFPKLSFEKFDEWSSEMETYCIRDVELNAKVYEHLAGEASRIISKYPLFKKGIEVEMKFAIIEADIREKGWKFDMEGALALQQQLQQAMDTIESTLEPKIGMRCIAKDGKQEYKTPAWRKDGCYTVNTAKWFGLEPENGREERLVEGPYTRIEFVQGKLGTIEVVRDYLFSIGWVPDEYNVEKINGKFVNKSPKLTESSLLLLGDDGKAISDYYTIRARKGILDGWIEEASKDGRLHGRMWTIGTPTFRCRHEVVANVPSVDSIYGPEMRRLLTCESGYSIVGADSAGNQMRGLCHDINDAEFTDTVINGDVHQRNADVLSSILPTSRKTAKPFLYAFLFGGGAGKLGLILSGKRDAKLGQAALDKFQDSIPGMKQLKESLNETFNASAQAFGADYAFIRGLDGRFVFVGSSHQLLNYRLQTTEGITCKAAIVYLKEKLEDKGIDYYFALHYHDELAVVVPDQYADEVAELAVEAFTEAPKWFGVHCMNGAAHVGKTYAEVH
jgi:DNA polymerase I-like protein with 3'-5' exonuclease and polymerase domains